MALIDPFVPNLGDTFTIIDAAGGVSGVFDLINGVLVDSALSLAVIYNAFDVTVHAALPGDVNLDGEVNLLDLNAWLADGAGQWSNGDLNGDGAINLGDLNIWLASPSASPFAPSTIPEPATLAVLIAGWGLTWRRRRVQWPRGRGLVRLRDKRTTFGKERLWSGEN